MAYVKKYATPAELSAALSRAAKSRKHNNGGRPKGSKNKNPSGIMPKEPAKTLTVREPDYKVYVRCAFAANVPIVEFMHMNAEGLKRRNPHLFGEAAQGVEA